MSLHKKKQIAKNVINILEFISKECKNKIVEGDNNLVSEFQEYSKKNAYLNEVLREVLKNCEADEVARILIKNVKVSSVDKKENIRILELLLKGNKDPKVDMIVRRILNHSNKMQIPFGFTLAEIVVLFVQTIFLSAKNFSGVGQRKKILQVKKNMRVSFAKEFQKISELMRMNSYKDKDQIRMYLINIWNGRKNAVPVLFVIDNLTNSYYYG